jgi:hypothetical protein
MFWLTLRRVDTDVVVASAERVARGTHAERLDVDNLTKLDMVLEKVAI